MSSSAEVEKAMAPIKAQDDPNAPADVKCYLQSLMMNSPNSEEDLLKNCFQGYSDLKVHISADDLYGAMKSCRLNPTLEDIEETISHVKREAKDEEVGQMNFDELVKIAKLLVVPRVVDQLAKACRVLGGYKKKKVVLYGESGVGKTWMLKKIAGHAIRKGDFDVAIWVYLNRIYEGLSLHESIAYQLSVLTDFEKSEAEEARVKEDFERTKAKEAKKEEDQLEEEEGEQKESEETKETKRRDKFERLIREKLKKKKKLLLVVDNEGSNWSEVDSTDGKKLLLHFKLNTIDLGEILALNMVEDFKVLISTRKEPTKPEQPGSEGIELMVRPLNWEESRSFVDQHIEGVVERDDLKKLADFFIGKSGRLPVEILIMARVLSFFGKNDLGMKKLREDKEKIEKVKGLQVVDVLIKGYTRIPKSVLMDCFSLETNHERHFLHRGGMVNFNELIVYWIIEGHLGQCGRIKDAYEEGHRVFMELMHCGLLDKQEGDYITPSGAKFSFGIHDWHEFYRKPRSGLGVTYDMKLGRVAWDEGLIKTVSNSFVQREREKKITTLMLDGNHFLTAKLPADNLFKSPLELETIAKKIEPPNANTLFDSLTELENLAVFDPTGQHFSRPVEMKKLRFLVLRGCQYMKEMEPFFVWRNDHKNPQQKPLQRSQSLPTTLPQMHSQNPNSPTSQSVSHALEKLTVLEISGPSLMEKIPENLFENMLNLKTLNMSYLPIHRLPSLFFKLTKIEFLILRGCSNLEELETLTNFKDLQIIDVSGSTSFQKFHDKSLHVNTKLQILNLSKTKIQTFPLINSNPLLKFVSVSDCVALERIRKISKLKNLQIFDISGAILVEEFCDPSLEDLKGLEILDVSRTAITRLPSKVCNPKFLYVKGCSHIKRLPPVEDFSLVEVIDLSGTLHLEEINVKFFEKMKCIQELYLSKTRVKQVPFISSLVSLHRLLMVDCELLEKLEKLSSLEELEFLDLSGCKSLKKIEDDSFDKMNHLHYLNLSGIQLDLLPSLANLKKLEELYVRDCPKLTELKGVKELPVLRVLDHLGTILRPEPSFTNGNPPRVVGVNTDNIDYQQVLTKLCGVSAADKSESSDHQSVDFKECQQVLTKLGGVSAAVESESSDHQSVDFRKENQCRCKWSISNWRVAATLQLDEQKLGGSVDGIHFRLLLKKHPILLMKCFSRFHFLVYPREKEADVVPYKDLYRSELAIRDIYFGQVSQDKLEKCLEIREFDNAPPFMGDLLKQAQLVVLIDDPFLKSLLDLGAEFSMDMKACWIERCDHLEHVASQKEEKDEKPKVCQKQR